MANRVHISYFSDVLCVWAYVAQVRLDELLRRHGADVHVEYRYVPVFGATAQRIGEGWRERGGFGGYADHVADVCSQFDHAELHADAWRTVRPTSSAPSHLFLSALQLAGVAAQVFEQAAWRLRRAFFAEARDVSRHECLWQVAADLALPEAAMRERLADGSAHAALMRDVELCASSKIEGSPTYLLNEGRQRLYGNLGYRVIEANVQELLERPTAAASWC